MIELLDKSADDAEYSTVLLYPKLNISSNLMDSKSDSTEDFNRSSIGKPSKDINEDTINLKTNNDYLTISIKDTHLNQKEDKLMRKRLEETDYQRTFHVDNNLKKHHKSTDSQDNFLGIHLPKGHRDKKSLLLLK